MSMDDALASRSQIAIYLDFDNIVISRYNELHGSQAFRDDRAGGRNPTALVRQRLAEARLNIGAIKDYAASFGTVAISRAYANWSNPVNSGYASDMMRASIDLVQMFPLTGTKNGADIRLAIDVIDDLARYPYLTHVLVVAGDSDYVALAQRCKRLGRRVIGIGAARSVGRYWEAACDEFRYYNSVLTAVTAEVEKVLPVPAPDSEQLQAGTTDTGLLLVKATRLMHSKTMAEWVAAAGVKSLMQRLDPGFDEVADGFKTFTAFLRSRSDFVNVLQTESGTMVRLRELGDVSGEELIGSRPTLTPAEQLRKHLGLGGWHVTPELEDLSLRAVRLAWEVCSPESSVVHEGLPSSAVRARLLEQGVSEDLAKRATHLALAFHPVLLRDTDMRLRPNPELEGSSDDGLRHHLRAGLVERLRSRDGDEAVPLETVVEAIHGPGPDDELLTEYKEIWSKPGFRRLCEAIGPMLMAAPVLWDVAAAMVAVPPEADLPSAEALGQHLAGPLLELDRDPESVSFDSAYLSFIAAGVIDRRDSTHRSCMSGVTTEEIAGAVTRAWARYCQELDLDVLVEPFYRIVLPDRFHAAWRTWVRDQIRPD
jgi:NYN domain